MSQLGGLFNLKCYNTAAREPSQCPRRMDYQSCISVMHMLSIELVISMDVTTLQWNRRARNMFAKKHMSLPLSPSEILLFTVQIKDSPIAVLVLVLCICTFTQICEPLQYYESQSRLVIYGPRYISPFGPP